MSRCVVVGGGLAGIAAALDLAAAGTEVILVEVRPRLGGAAYSVERGGLHVDNGQHVFLRCCTEYRSLLERIGASSGVVLQERLSIPVLGPAGQRGELRRSGMPAPMHLAGALLRYPFLSPLDRLRAARAALALGRLDRTDPALDDVTFGDWLRGHGASATAIDRLWDVIALPTLNLRANEASLALAATVFQIGLLSAADAGDVGYARVPLGQLHGEAAERALAGAGVEVRLRSRARAVARGPGGGFTVELDGDALDADAVVVAVPHDRAERLLPEGALADGGALAALGSSPIVNLHVVYDRRVTELPFAAAVSSPVQYVFDRTEQSGLTAGQYLAVSLSGAAREMAMTPDALRAEFLPALEAILPAARGARVERFFVTREHAATFRAAPGVERLRPGPRTDLPGLTLAGAWTDTGWPATMEGAVRSGRAAAAEALAAMGSAPRQRAQVA